MYTTIFRCVLTRLLIYKIRIVKFKLVKGESEKINSDMNMQLQTISKQC